MSDEPTCVADLAGKADYTVLDTDYDTYAVVYECQKVASFLHRKSTAILSRKPTLSQEIISKVRVKGFRVNMEGKCAGMQ